MFAISSNDLAILKAMRAGTLIIGEPYTPALLDRYDWHGCWPVVDVNADGTVGRVDAITDGDDAALVPVRIVDGRVVEVGPECNDAMALRHELASAGFDVDEEG